MMLPGVDMDREHRQTFPLALRARENKCVTRRRNLGPGPLASGLLVME